VTPSGARGVWEYSKALRSDQVFLAIVLLARDPATKKRVVILKKEWEPCTHELKSISHFSFGSVSLATAKDNDDLVGEAIKRTQQLIPGADDLRAVGFNSSDSC
jgi:hypothetical protein